MAESEIRSSSRQGEEDQSLQQPKGAVQMADVQRIGADHASSATATTSSPHGPAFATKTSTDHEGASKDKGKELDLNAKDEEAGGLVPDADGELGIEAAAATGGVEEDRTTCKINLLLPTGARHPFTISDKYLSKRGVEVPDMTEAGKMDVFSISVYKLKELILREWRDEWEGKPTSPANIRLIFFGRLLEDKKQLKDYQFSVGSPNVVHMSVRPAEMLEEEEAGKTKSNSSANRNREGGSGCCIIL